MDYPLNENVYDLIGQVKSKTICSDFDEQLDISEELYKGNLKFYFTKKDVQNLLKEADGYSEEILERVETILYQQMRKYQYLF